MPTRDGSLHVGEGEDAEDFIRAPEPDALTQTIKGELPGREPPLMTGPSSHQDREAALSLVARHYRIANTVLDGWAASFSARLTTLSQLIAFQGTSISQGVARGLLPLLTTSVVGGPAVHIVALITGGVAGLVAELGGGSRQEQGIKLQVKMIDEFLDQFINMKFMLMNGQTDLESAIAATEHGPYWGEERSLLTLVERELGGEPPRVTPGDFEEVDQRIELELWKRWAKHHWELRLGVDWNIRGANKGSQDRLRLRFGIDLRDREEALAVAQDWGMRIVRQPIPRF